MFYETEAAAPSVLSEAVTHFITHSVLSQQTHTHTHTHTPAVSVCVTVTVKSLNKHLQRAHASFDHKD